MKSCSIFIGTVVVGGGAGAAGVAFYHFPPHLSPSRLSI